MQAPNNQHRQCTCVDTPNLELSSYHLSPTYIPNVLNRPHPHPQPPQHTQPSIHTTVYFEHKCLRPPCKSSRVSKRRASKQQPRTTTQRDSATPRRSSRLQAKHNPPVPPAKNPVINFVAPPSSQQPAKRRYTETAEDNPPTTTAKLKFAEQLGENKIIHIPGEAQPPCDIEEIRKMLEDDSRKSEPPNQDDWEMFLLLTSLDVGKWDVIVRAYPLLSGENRERERLGYCPKGDHAWGAIDNHLTVGLGSAKPNVADSFEGRNYPRQVLEQLGGDIAPCDGDFTDGMAAYAAEFKKPGADTEVAALQSAYDGALMVEGARAIHNYLEKPAAEFYGKTHALTVVCDGNTLRLHTHHVRQVAEEGENDTDNFEYHQYLVLTDNPKTSLEDFRRTCKHDRNARDIAYAWASQRKDEIWAHFKAQKDKGPLLVNATSNDFVARASDTPRQSIEDAPAPAVAETVPAAVALEPAETIESGGGQGRASKSRPRPFVAGATEALGADPKPKAKM